MNNIIILGFKKEKLPPCVQIMVEDNYFKNNIYFPKNWLSFLAIIRKLDNNVSLCIIAHSSHHVIPGNIIIKLSDDAKEKTEVIPFEELSVEQKTKEHLFKGIVKALTSLETVHNAIP